MKERPIIFSAPMVRALLAGTKTQTRRVVKGIKQPGDTHAPVSHAPEESCLLEDASTWRFDYAGGVSRYDVRCPYGHGDRLWVRETWAAPHAYDHLPPRLIPHDARIHYAATEDRGGLMWRSPIFMPRHANRITLEISSLRVERLQDISGPDCWAEGIDEIREKGDEHGDLRGSVTHDYRTLWESINGVGSWDANHWVWVVEFNKVKP